MSEEFTNKTPAPGQGGEDLNKSIDELLEEAFPALKKAKDASCIVRDSETTADAALKKVPGSENDKNRNAGRPKEISDVPAVDRDGARSKQYDSDVAEREDKEEENEEAKKQSRAVDQVSEVGHTNKKPKAPPMRPFTKGDDFVSDEDFKKSFKRFEEFEAFRNAESEQVKPASPQMVEISQEELDELKKGVEKRGSDSDSLIKSEEKIKSIVSQETETLKKSVEDLMKTNQEQLALLKSIGRKPVSSRAITSIEALEKSQNPTIPAEKLYFTKAEISDAAYELAKAGTIDSKIVMELEMTGNVSDPQAKALIEKKLQV